MGLGAVPCIPLGPNLVKRLSVTFLSVFLTMARSRPTDRMGYVGVGTLRLPCTCTTKPLLQRQLSPPGHQLCSRLPSLPPPLLYLYVTAYTAGRVVYATGECVLACVNSLPPGLYPSLPPLCLCNLNSTLSLSLYVWLYF